MKMRKKRSNRRIGQTSRNEKPNLIDFAEAIVFGLANFLINSRSKCCGEMWRTPTRIDAAHCNSLLPYLLAPHLPRSKPGDVFAPVVLRNLKPNPVALAYHDDVDARFAPVIDFRISYLHVT